MKWEKVRLKKLITIKNGKDHKELEEGIYPVYGSGGCMRYVNQYLYDKVSILLPRKGTLNNIQYVDRPFWTVDTCYYTEIFEDVVEPYFLFLQLKLKDINSLNTGAAVPSMTFDKYYSIEISLPPLPTQRRIADILSAYDDLIENNRKQIKLLEEAAQRLYKEWFVDLRFPGHEKVKVTDGVPEGWEKGKIEQLACFSRGQMIISDDVIPGDVPVVAGGLQPSCYHNKANTTSPVVTVSASGANAGYIRLYFVDVFASDCSFIDGRSCSCVYFVYCFFRNDVRILRNLQHGSAQPHVYASQINDIALTIPNRKLIKTFEDIVKSYFEEIAFKEKQIKLLQEARDRLLPKLMSGEIEV